MSSIKKRLRKVIFIIYSLYPLDIKKSISAYSYIILNLFITFLNDLKFRIFVLFFTFKRLPHIINAEAPF